MSETRLLRLRHACGAGRYDDQEGLREGESHLVSSNGVGVCTLPPGNRVPGPVGLDTVARAVLQDIEAIPVPGKRTRCSRLDRERGGLEAAPPVAPVASTTELAARAGATSRDEP